MAERHYKKITGKNGYDQARGLGPVLMLEKLSNAGET